MLKTEKPKLKGVGGGMGGGLGGLGGMFKHLQYNHGGPDGGGGSFWHSSKRPSTPLFWLSSLAQKIVVKL